MLKESKMLEFKGLLKIPSNSDNHEALHEAGNCIREMLDGVPVSWKRVQVEGAADFFVGRSNEMNPTRPVVILSGHLDVVPEVKNPEVDGEYVYASGAYDMKGGVYAMVEVVRGLHENGMCKNLILALNTQEEIGNPQHGKTIARLAKEGDYVLVFEGGEESESNKWHIVKTRKGARAYKINITKQPDVDDAVLHLGVIDLIQGINSAVDYDIGTTANVGVVKQIRGGPEGNGENDEGTYFQLVLNGPGGHSGNLEGPDKRHSTLNILADTLKDISVEDDLEIVGLEGGNAVNAIPNTAEAVLYVSGDKKSASMKISDVLRKNSENHEGEVDCSVSTVSPPDDGEITGYSVIGEYRFRAKEEDERMRSVVKKSVKEIRKKGLVVEIDDKTRFPNLDKNTQTTKFIELVQGIAEEQGIKLVFEDRAGSSDANHFSGGNPKIAVLDGFGPRGSNQHTSKERMSLRSLETSVKFGQGVIEKLIEGNG